MRRTIAALLVLATLLAAGSAGAKVHPDPGGGAPQSDHQRVVSFWTPSRQANATDRTIAVKEKVRSGPRPDTAASAWTGGEPVSITAGRVFFTERNAAYSCSGSAVSSAHGNLVMTAGHCAFDRRDGWVTDWMFVPGWTGPTATKPLGAWTATDLFTTRTWWQTGSFDDDAAFVVVTGDEGRGTLEAELASRGVSAPALGFTAPVDGDHITAFGYPAAKRSTGNQLSFCDSTAMTGVDGTGTFAIACDMTAGSSGGPWYGTLPSGADAGTIRSVTSYGYPSMKGYLFGPVFNDPERFAYIAASRGGDCAADQSTGYACTEQPAF